MKQTALLAAIAFALSFSFSHAEEPNPLDVLVGEYPQVALPFVMSPIQGTWKLETDLQLDGEVKESQSTRILLESANNRIVGYPEELGSEHTPRTAFITGQFIPGTVTMVNLRHEIESGYTAVYIGRVVSEEKMIGSYADNTGRAGDWSLTRAESKSKIAPLIEKKVNAGPLKIDPLTKPLSDDLYFESVLGIYGKAIRGDKTRFINLRPPDRNLWTQEIENTVDGKLSYAEAEYVGTAKFQIPEAGTYNLDLPGAGVEIHINGQRVEAGQLELKEGLYVIEIYTNHWGQPYLTYAQVFIHPPGSNDRIPFINSAHDVEKFRKQKIGGKRVVEVCQYTLKPVEVQQEREQ